jgi:hypothetical protein
MKKVIYLFVLLCIGANHTSCTPENMLDQAQEQACCDGEGTIPPPPPPPPGEDEVGG